MPRYIMYMLVSAGVVGLALIYFFGDARTGAFFPPCPLHATTGLYCPGCGSQRAFSSLLHGDVLAALRFNILFVAAIPLLLYAAILTIANKFYTSKNLFYKSGFATAVLLIVVVFGISRNLPYFPFNLLAPHS